MWDGTPETRCNRCKEKSLPCSAPQTSVKRTGLGKDSRLEIDSRSSSVPAYTMSGWDPQTNGSATYAGTQRNGTGPSLYGQGPQYPTPVSPQSKNPRSATWNGSPTHSDDLILTNPSQQTITTNFEAKYHQSSNGTSYYQYAELGGPNHIRLLKLNPSRESDEINANFSLINLEADRPSYEALSYCWGNDPPQHHIRVEGSILPVRPNLYEALSTIRNRETSQLLWIDAVCINQHNAQERGNQVQRMSEIYSKAESVLIWLGSGNSDGEIALSFLKELLNLEQFDKLVETESEKWKSVEELLRNKWFTRRWVLQDVALARKATLQWGKAKILWEDFADAIRILGARVDRITNLKKNANFLNTDSTRRALPATAYMDATQSIFKKAGNGETIERLCSLELLVSSMVAFGASDPRDTIYAVLSLAKKGHNVVANYSKEVLDVYSDFVEYCINTSCSLDIICRHWAHIPPRKKARFRENQADTLPSWIPSVLGSPFATFDDVNSNNRLHGDSFVGLPDRKCYNASLGMQVDDSVYIRKLSISSEWGSQIYRILPVKGLEISRIKEIGERAIHGTIPSEWLEIGGWVSIDASSENVPPHLPDKLWRTLVADRDPDGYKAPGWYRRACLHCLTRPSQDPDINTRQMIKNTETPSLVIDFLKRVQSVIWNRKFFTTSGRPGEEQVGLAPAQAQVGDTICILFGCSVPVLLRKQDSGQYKLIGEVYLHEMMDGQALVGRTKDQILSVSQNFELI